MTKDEIQTRIEQVKNYIQDCERRVSQGESVDLSGLDKNVEELCEVVTTLPSKEGKHFQGKLETLVLALDELVKVIHQFHSEDESIENE